VILNGKSVSESEWFGFSWGRIGVPVIFIAGDDRLQADVKPTMPWARFVMTKRATSASTADLRPVDEVHAEMKVKAKDAIEHLAEMKVMKIGAPIRATLHAVPPASLMSLQDVPGLDYKDNSVTFVAADFPAAYKGILGLVRVATSGYASVMNETLRASGMAPQITSQYRENLFARWTDNESGRWTAPAPQAVPAGRKYHGSN
jgi:D-aminopeptidase